MFCLNFGPTEIRVYRRKGEEYLPQCLKPTVKFPVKVMVWGCITVAGVGELCVLTTNVTGEVYIEILENFLIPSIEKLCPNDNFIFQQDGAKPHMQNRLPMVHK